MDIREELIGRAHELKPVIASRAAATEQNRAMLDETLRDICDAGFLQILVPKRYGGYELHVDTLAEVSRIISSADPSTGWVTSFYIGHNWLHAIFPEQAQKEAFANRPFELSAGLIAPTATAVRAPGGYEVCGRQSWSSGVTHAEWIFFTGMLTEEGAPPQPTMFCIPRADVEVIDNWNIAGMSGTGSNDVSVERVFVPEHRAVSSLALFSGSHPGSRCYTNPLYRMAAGTVLSFEIRPVLAGALRGVAEQFLATTRDRIASYTGASVAAKPSAQMRIGRAFAAADAVDTLLRGSVDFVIGLGDRSPTPEELAGLRMSAAMITKLTSDSVNDVMHGAGGNSFRSDCPLQRFFRDVNVMRTHAALDFETSSEIYGRIMLGMDPGGMV
jgi:3-hydroxy-9,10-secoandrosta-1,3,5(10)-triene-9,17-dione monooxygenase